MTRFSLTALISLGVLLLISGASNAQRRNQREQRDHVFLPQARGATVMGSWISAQAQYQAAAGDYLESVAVARLFHAEATLKELEAGEKALEINRKWLEYHFEKKLLNREYRRKLDPTHLEREVKRERVADSQVRNAPSRLIEETDLTGKLNWLHLRLAVSPVGRKILNGTDQDNTFKDLDLPLSLDELSGLNLCLIERVNGQENVFRADRGSALASQFPLVLRHDTFHGDRVKFQELKMTIADDVKDGYLDYSTLEHAEKVIGQFMRSLDREYPSDRRDSHPSVFFEYKEGLDYLKVQRAAIRMAIESDDVDGLDGGLAFHGETLFQLLNHMSKRGLRFAPASPGNKHVYTNMFLAMRDVYLRCNPNPVDDVEIGFQR
jgi:hypothetical protein